MREGYGTHVHYQVPREPFAPQDLGYGHNEAELRGEDLFEVGVLFKDPKDWHGAVDGCLDSVADGGVG